MKRTIFLLPMLGLLACSGTEQTDQTNAAMEVYAAAQDAAENGICACAEAIGREDIAPPDGEIPPPPDVMPPEEPPCELPEPPPLPCELPEPPPLPCDNPEEPCERPDPPLPCDNPEEPCELPEPPPLPCDNPEEPCERPEPPQPCETPDGPCEHPERPQPSEFPEEPVAPPPSALPPPPPIDPVDCPCAETPLPPCEAAFVTCVDSGQDPGMDCGQVLVDCLAPDAPEVPGPMDCEAVKKDCETVIGDAGLCQAEFDLCMVGPPPPPHEMPDHPPVIPGEDCQ